ncbi:predicted protein, partial [Nematostella vectensis]
VFSVGGNTIVLLAIFKYSSLRTTSNMFIASLALADWIVGALANPFYVSLSLMKSIRDIREIKNTETFVWLLTVAATQYNLCAVSIDRFIAVSKPMHYRQVVTVPRCLVVIALTWFFAALLGSSAFLVPYDQISGVWIAGSVITGFIPAVVISFCYSQIVIAAKTQTNKINEAQPRNSQQQTIEETRNRLKNRKAAWTFGIVIVLFVVLYLPSLVTNFITLGASTQCDFFDINRLWFWTSMICYSSSAINPWVYAIRMREFRTSVKRLLTC